MEPERDIEKLLRAGAEKRRTEAGGPFDLHPATRRMLLGEVMRRYAFQPRERGGWLSLLARYRSRLALVTSTVLMVCLGAWLLAPLWRGKPEGGDIALARKLEEQSELPTARIDRALAPTANSPAPKPADDTGIASRALNREPAPSNLADKDVATASPSARSEAKLQSDGVTTPSPAAAPAAEQDVAIAALEPAAVAPTTAAPRPPTGAAAAQRRYGLTPAPSAAPRAEGGATTLSEAPANQPAQFAMADSQQRGGGGSSLASTAKPGVGAREALTVASAPAPAGVAQDLLKSSAQEAYGSIAGEARLTQDFAQVTVAAKKAASGGLAATGGGSASLVLRSFRVEQVGQQIRVIDSDDSIYTGSIQPLVASAAPLLTNAASPPVARQKELPETLGRAAAARKSGAKPAIGADQSAARPWAVPTVVRFSVTGTNRTSKLSVLFSGSWVQTPVSAPPPAAPAPASTAQSNKTDSKAKAVPNALQGIHITGKAVVGKEEIQIEAMPAKR